MGWSGKAGLGGGFACPHCLGMQVGSGQRGFRRLRFFFGFVVVARCTGSRYHYCCLDEVCRHGVLIFVADLWPSSPTSVERLYAE